MYGTCEGQLNHAASSVGSTNNKDYQGRDMMEGARESASPIVQTTRSGSPSTLNNEAPQIEPMMADVKVLPARYEQCDFSDLVELIGMEHPCHHVFVGVVFSRIPLNYC